MISKAFEALGATQPILESLEEMGFTEPTPVQARSIPLFIEGHDLLVQAPTGTGKTCAFGVPLLQKLDAKDAVIQALILSPTRELALQIAEVFNALKTHLPGVRIATVYGGEPIERQFAALRAKPQILVATPGRLMDHMQRGTVKLGHIHTVVLDEADRMLDMGFRPDIQKILRQVPKERQTVLYSATLSGEVLSIAKTYQKDARTVEIEQESKTVDTVEQFYIVAPQGGKNAALLHLLKKKQFPLAIIFTNSKHRADRLAKTLRQRGFNAAALHGDMNQSKRERVMQQYREGSVQLLVATDVAARGLDVQNIDAVINYDIPRDDESYVHRIGRTGRASAHGMAYTLIFSDEQERLMQMRKNLDAPISPAEIALWPHMISAAEAAEYAQVKDGPSHSFTPRPQRGRPAQRAKPPARPNASAGKAPASAGKAASSAGKAPAPARQQAAQDSSGVSRPAGTSQENPATKKRRRRRRRPSGPRPTPPPTQS